MDELGFAGWNVKRNQKKNVPTYTLKHATHGTHEFSKPEQVQAFLRNGDEVYTPVRNDANGVKPTQRKVETSSEKPILPSSGPESAERMTLMRMTPAARADESAKLLSESQELAQRKIGLEENLAIATGDAKELVVREMTVLSRRMEGNESRQMTLRRVNSLALDLSNNGISPVQVIDSLASPEKRSRLAQWIDTMKSTNPAKRLAILTAVTGLAYYLWPKSGKEVPPPVRSEAPAEEIIEAACAGMKSGIAK